MFTIATPAGVRCPDSGRAVRGEDLAVVDPHHQRNGHARISHAWTEQTRRCRGVSGTNRAHLTNIRRKYPRHAESQRELIVSLNFSVALWHRPVGDDPGVSGMLVLKAEGRRFDPVPSQP